MRIMLTNDDGYRAPGINAVFDALLEAGHEVIMVAPELNSSGAGQSIAVYAPMSITKVNEQVYFVSSTPADSVRLGLHVVYEHKKNYPDLLISGINMGENIGEDVNYSGTVGAAREGILHGISSMAFSTPGPLFNQLDSAAKVVVDLVTRLEKNPQIMFNPFLWNINIPNKPYHLITGFEATKLGLRPPHKPMEKQLTPRGHTIYWQGESSDPEKAPIGTDIDVYLKQEKVSITPLKILPTDYGQMPVITALCI
jgi:5'-nucleotidase